MPVPSRPPPRLGAPVNIKHFGGESDAAVITAIEEDGRRVRVCTRDGGEQEFVLSAKTARFVSVEGPHGPRLELLG